jgi:hypothetical protein
LDSRQQTADQRSDLESKIGQRQWYIAEQKSDLGAESRTEIKPWNNEWRE